MLPETILIPKSIKEAEDRFVIKVKEQFLTIIKEVNRLEKRIATIKEFTGLEDLLDKIRGKANVDASNVGQNGDIDTTGLWGEALGAGEVREIDNKLVNGSTVYKEVRPPGMLIAYNYIAEQKTTADNLISLDTKLKEVDDEVKSIVIPTFDTSGLARVNLANIDYDAEAKINGIARSSIEIKPAENSNMTITKVLEGKVETYYLKAHGSSIPDIYAHKNADNVGRFYYNSLNPNMHWSQISTRDKVQMVNWGEAISSGSNKIQYKETSGDGFDTNDINPYEQITSRTGLSNAGMIPASIATVYHETREGYYSHNYVQNFDGFQDDLCFIDSDQSVGYTVYELHDALINVTNGLHTLWESMYGFLGRGSPYYPEDSEYIPSGAEDNGIVTQVDNLEYKLLRIYDEDQGLWHQDIRLMEDEITSIGNTVNNNHETRIQALERALGIGN